MPRRKKEPTPNYDLMRQSYVEKLKYALHVYKEEVKRGLDCMWIGEDGMVCLLDDCNAANIEKAGEELKEASNALSEFDTYLKTHNKIRLRRIR